jgi:hypothetical protein
MGCGERQSDGHEAAATPLSTPADNFLLRRLKFPRTRTTSLSPACRDALPNELLRAFSGELRVLRYEDSDGETEWAPGRRSHMVRLIAEKMNRPSAYGQRFAVSSSFCSSSSQQPAVSALATSVPFQLMAAGSQASGSVSFICVTVRLTTCTSRKSGR